MDLIEKIVRLENQASEFGFQWETREQIMEQIQSECLEIEEHLNLRNSSELEEEIGDLMHAVFSLSVFCGFDPRQTLQKTTNKFEMRLNAVINIANEKGLENLKGFSFGELMQIWKMAKQRVG